VLLIGTGGLGCPVAIGLAAAGVGRLTVLDDDRVDETNLARQMLYGTSDVGALKANALAHAITARFPSVAVQPLAQRFADTATTRALIHGHDLVVDGSDNFPTRFLANDLCVKLGRPLVHGAAIRWQGQVLTIVPGETPCLRCIFESEPPAGAAPTCAEAGVISPLVGVIGGWMVEAAVELLSQVECETDAGPNPPAPFPAREGGATRPWRCSDSSERSERVAPPSLPGKGAGGLGARTSTSSHPSTAHLRTLDAWTGRERLVPLGRDPDCPACGKHGA
jgi:molybdopterin/thiamine biosynthesis adenylyltransferase